MLTFSEISLYDMKSFDPDLGRILLEFHALVTRKKILESSYKDKSTLESKISFYGTI